MLWSMSVALIPIYLLFRSALLCFKHSSIRLMRDKNTPMNLLNGRGEKERPRTTASGLMSFRVLEKRNNECTSHTCECGLGLSLSLSLSLSYSSYCPKRWRARGRGRLAGRAGLGRSAPRGPRMDVRQLRTLFFSLFKKAGSLAVAGCSLYGLGWSVCTSAVELQPRLPLTLSHARSPPLLPFGMVGGNY